MLFSSSEVYGKGVTVPFSEDDDRVMGPTHKLRWSYAVRQGGGRVPGPGLLPAAPAAGDGGALLQHLRAAPDGRLRHGDPEHDRSARCATSPSWCSATASSRAASRRCSDVVRGVLLLADSREAEGEIFNIGTDEEVTVLELAQRIRTLCESELGDRVRAVREGLRQLVRGHAPPRAGPREDPTASSATGRRSRSTSCSRSRSATSASRWACRCPVGLAAA